MTFYNKIKDKTLSIGVMGLGYVGLPLIREFIKQGFNTYGFDIDEKKIKSLKKGKSYIKHISDDLIASWFKEEKFHALSADSDLLSEMDAILICVPTPLTKNREPNMEYVNSTIKTIKEKLTPEQLVILESTTWPGTTEEIIQPILDLRDINYYLAFSPEREDPGNPKYSTSTIPKVVGGINEESLKRAVALYNTITTTVPVSTCATAEATKLTENIFRLVNISLVNELKLCYDKMGIDIWEVIEAAKTKPFGFMPFYPSSSAGGHCIPIDPFYLSWRARKFDFTPRFIELAGEINFQMPDEVINKVMFALNEEQKSLKNSDILILGVAYKPNVDDLRESPALKIITKLKDLGANVDYHDPHCKIITSGRHYNLDMKSVSLTKKRLLKTDCILIITHHDAVDYQFLVDNTNLIVDTRNICNGLKGKAKIVKA